MSDNVISGHVPVGIVIIGGKSVLVQEYTCTMTSKGEANTASIKIPLENIDSEVFANDSILEDIHEVEIWAGYVEDKRDRSTQIKEILGDINGQKYLTKRFSGFVTQPEWDFGSAGESVQLSCADWTGILREYKLYKNFEDSKCEVRTIIETLQKDITGITIELEPYVGSAKLGKYDNTKNKTTFHSMGKSYWEVIRECAVKLGYIVITDHKVIKLVPQKKDPFIWNIFYGPAEKIVQKTQDPKDASKTISKVIGQFCDNVKIRYGQKGRVDKSNVVVELHGAHLHKRVKKKKVEDKRLVVIFPEDSVITSMTNYVRKYIPGNATEQELKIIAADIYREHSKRLMTCTIEMPFGNNYMNLWDIAEFVIDPSKPNVSFLDGKQFVINTITESFSDEGLKQSLEVDSDPMWHGTAVRKFAPIYERPRPGAGLIDSNGKNLA